MAKVKFGVTMETYVEVEWDDDQLPVPDDEWRSQMYASIVDQQSMARHFAYNHVVNAVEDISNLDGWADQPKGLVKFGYIRVADDPEVVELETAT